MALQGLTDFVLRPALSQPADDTAAAGGAIDPLMRSTFAQLSVATPMVFQSDGADTRSVDLIGILANLTRQTETVVLTGATEKASANTYKYMISVKAQTTSASRIVSVKQGLGGLVRGLIPLNEKGFSAPFDGSASSSGGPLSRYAKFFWQNIHGSLSATACQMEPLVDASNTLTYALGAAVNDTVQVANRLTAPAGLTFTALRTILSFPNLAAGAAWPVWLKQTLPPSNPLFWQPWTLHFYLDTAA